MAMSDLRPLDLTEGIRNRSALVTGGARGIGRACVEALLDHGARVALTYNRSQKEAELLAERWPDRVSHHFLDLGDPSSAVRCLDEIEARWETPSILVNNAAVGSATVSRYEPDPQRQNKAFFDINAFGTFHVAKVWLERVERDLSGPPRKLINISSVGGLQVFPMMRLADNMSKAAVLYMSQQLAAELTHKNIEVFVLCPGATNTEMFRRSTLDKLDAQGRQQLLSRLPRGRLIQPEEIARLVVFLCSPYAGVLHGAVLDCSLGLGVHPGLLTGSH